MSSPIRLSGLSSGLDTESLVKALVSGYNLKKDNLVKAQTKLQWKQDSWKDMNKKIYGFYSGKLSTARMSNSYNLKSSSISDSTIAKVTASTGAVSGTQTLKVNKLATTGYLTGGEVSAKDADGNSVKASGSSKISDLMGSSFENNGTITLSTNGKSTDISISKDMTVNQFVGKLKDAGLNASFDENNQRFFISSKTSGAASDFSLTAGDANGLTALKNMGIYTVNDKDMAEYQKWADYSDEELSALEEKEYKSRAYKSENVSQEYADKYNAAKTARDKITSDASWTGIDTERQNLSDKKSAFDTKYDAYKKTDSEGKVTYDTDAMDEDTKKAYLADKAEIDNLESKIKKYDEYTETMDNTKGYVTFEDEKAVADGTNQNAIDETARRNEALRAGIDANYESKRATAQTVIASGNQSSEGAKRLVGSDSEIELNGAVFKSNTNNYSINGLTIQANALTTGNGVTITTDTDVDGIYKQIKDFFKDYNELIKNMDTAYNASSSKGYEPLTSDEKEAMSDKEVEEWETKIKDSLLRKDSTLGNASSAMKTLMNSTINIGGKNYSLASFGIKTQDYFASGENEKGVYHIDGDKDDSVSSGNEDKLKAAIAANPEAVSSFFSQLTTKVYNDLGKKMGSTSMSSIYTLYNDKQMTTEYNDYKTKISDMESQITTWEDYYYKKFSKMESAMATLNQTQSSLSGYFS